jgi:hypothetical protein
VWRRVWTTRIALTLIVLMAILAAAALVLMSRL